MRRKPPAPQILIGLLFACFFIGIQSRCHGQAAGTEGVALLQTEPYDLVVVKESAGGGEVKVKLLDFPGRTNPKKTTGVLIVEPLSHPGEQFEVSWAQLERIDLWEERLKREAETRIANKDFDGAYPYVAVMLRDYPKIPGLAEMRTQLVYQNALSSFQKGDAVRTLALLEELRRFNPRFQEEQISNAISRISDSMLQKMLNENHLAEAQMMLARLEKTYPAGRIASIDSWKKRFREMAEAKRAEAITAKDAGNFRFARQLALESLNIDPTVENGKELLHEIELAYPMVYVGVMQKAVELDPTRIENSAARRAGRLAYRALFEMLGAGIEGGEYKMPLGSFEVSQDQTQLLLRAQASTMPPPYNEVDAFDLADLLLARTRSTHPLYNPAWAGIVNEITVTPAGEVLTTLRRPHVLPHAMLQIRLDHNSLGVGSEKQITGSYLFEASDGGGVVFRFAGPGKPAATQPREIYEVTMKSGGEAITALLQGEVDIIDQLFPADAQKLRQTGKVKVGNYPLPTLHVLIPWSDHPYVNDRTTRRGMLLAMDRQLVLNSELTGGREIEGCQVISGPMPAGLNQDDPLGYAYDRKLEPLTYQPRLGALLMELRRRQWAKDAEKRKEPEPTYAPIRIAHPANEIARVACEAISQQLQGIKLEVKLIELPEGITQPEPNSCDLLYTIVAMWEPAVDARRLLGPDGLARSNDQLVGMGLRQLEAARNWREVRDGLFELHRICHSELPVLPLYQLVDSYAYRPELQNVGSGIVSLYQNIAQWRINR